MSNSDGMSLDIPRATKILEEEVKASIQRASFRMSAFVAAHMHKADAPDVSSRFGTSKEKTLAIITGKYLKSFMPGKPGNINKIKGTGKKIKWIFGTEAPQARAHEEGMFIKANAAKKSKRFKYQMSAYLWYRFMKDKNPAFKAMALSVEEKGGIQMPKRPVLGPAMEDYMLKPDGLQLTMDEALDGFKVKYGF